MGGKRSEVKGDVDRHTPFGRYDLVPRCGVTREVGKRVRHVHSHVKVRSVTQESDEWLDTTSLGDCGAGGLVVVRKFGEGFGEGVQGRIPEVEG